MTTHKISMDWDEDEASLGFVFDGRYAAIVIDADPDYDQVNVYRTLAASVTRRPWVDSSESNLRGWFVIVTEDEEDEI